MRKLRKVTVHEVIQNPAIDHEVNYVSAQWSSIPDEFIILYISHADYKVISFSLCTNVLMLTEGGEKSGWCKNALCWKGTVIQTHTHTHTRTGHYWSRLVRSAGAAWLDCSLVCIYLHTVRQRQRVGVNPKPERERERGREMLLVWTLNTEKRQGDEEKIKMSCFDYTLSHFFVLQMYIYLLALLQLCIYEVFAV